MKKKIIIIASSVVALIVIVIIFFSVILPIIKVKQTIDDVIKEDYVFEGNYYLEVNEKLFKGSFEGAKEDMNLHVIADINGADIIDAYYDEDGEILFNIRPFALWLYDVLPDKLLTTVGVDKLASEDKFITYEQVKDILDIDFDIVTDSKDISYSIKKLKESPFYRIEADEKMSFYKVLINDIPFSVGLYSEADKIYLAVSVTINEIYLELSGEIDLSQQQSFEIPKEKLSRGVVYVLGKVVSWLKEKY